jgi:hypothetical protein
VLAARRAGGPPAVATGAILEGEEPPTPC